MSFIKFPTQIKPARVTVALQRVQEVNASPLTNVQQVAARGNPAWRWTYEFTDLSDSERDIVQAFLLKCKGSVNAFKVTDPGDYEIKGSVSDWLDIFSGYGSFNVTAGSDSANVNSWFIKNSEFSHHITNEQKLRLEWRSRTSRVNLGWSGHGIGDTNVGSLEIGKAYLQRVKNFSDVPRKVTFQVGSINQSNRYYIQSSPQVNSTGVLSAPFVAVNTQHGCGVVDWTITGLKIGDHHELADYQLMRCALIANSENLITKSNEFDAAVWSQSLLTVESGWGDLDPVSGVSSGAWKIYGAASAGAKRLTFPAVTKATTEGVYAICIYAQADEYDHLRLGLRDSVGVPGRSVWFNLTVGSYGHSLPALDNIVARMFDVGSGWWKCGLSAVVHSADNIYGELHVAPNSSSITPTDNGSSGILIYGGLIREHPFFGHYVPTTTNTVDGSVGQTGSKLYVEGLEPEDTIELGQRFELINRYADTTVNSQSERSEFKRTTKEIKVHREGWAILEFDPPIRNAPATNRSWNQGGHLGEAMHNSVVFYQPEMKARLLAGTVQYIDKPLRMSDIVFDVLEDLTE